jgi:hypothetical protein
MPNGHGHVVQQDTWDWKTGIIVVLTIIFVALYVAGFAGWPKLAPDKEVIGPVAPIVAVIIGYYFGRVPSEKNEKSLQQQVNPRTQEAEHARNEQQQAQTDSTRLATKVIAARAALSAAAPAAPPDGLASTLSGAAGDAPDPEAIRQAAISALQVLDS